jgi:hypothetical protein
LLCDEKFQERLDRVSALLRRPAKFTDSSGFENAIVAAVEHPLGGTVAYVECRSKWVGRTQDINYQLNLLLPNGEKVLWEVETYNPFFGCNVRFLEWYGRAVLVIYREKHRMYAARVGIDGKTACREVADDWVLQGPQIAFRGWREPLVRRLTIPGLVELPALTEEQAAAWGLSTPREW